MARTALAFAVIACALILILGLQFVRGEKRDHFGTFADEASHYLTALMIRDYVAGGFPGPPVRFALDYYTHRPKVTFGAWPPFFHITLAAWMLLFPVSAPSVLFFTTLLNAILVGVFFAFARRKFPLPQSLAMAGAVALAPQLQQLSAMVLADTLHAILCVYAMFALSVYLEQRRPVFILTAGIATALAFLTKNNAVLLGIAIPLTILLTRSWWVFRQKAVWAAAAIAAAMICPWEMWAMHWVLGLVMHTTTLTEAIRFYSGALVTVVGWPLFVLAAFGSAAVGVAALRGLNPVPPIAAASFSLIVGTWLFHSMLPHETFERYLLPAIPAAAILAALGIQALTRKLPGTAKTPAIAALLWAGVLGSQAYGAIHMPPSADSTYPSIARFVLSHTPAGANGVILVSSDRNGEGAFISEVSSREPKLRLWMLRASKVLSHSGWHGEDYTLRFARDEDLIKYLDSVPVEMVLVDPPTYWHLKAHLQLLDVIASHPERFRPVLHTRQDEACRGDYCDVEVYRYNAPQGFAPVRIGVDPKEMIGRKLFQDWQIDRANPFIPK